MGRGLWSTEGLGAERGPFLKWETPVHPSSSSLTWYPPIQGREEVQGRPRSSLTKFGRTWSCPLVRNAQAPGTGHEVEEAAGALILAECFRLRWICSR